MYATINVLNSSFYNAGMQHANYFFNKALSYRFSKKKGEEFWGKTQKAPN